MLYLPFTFKTKSSQDVNPKAKTVLKFMKSIQSFLRHHPIYLLSSPSPPPTTLFLLIFHPEPQESTCQLSFKLKQTISLEELFSMQIPYFLSMKSRNTQQKPAKSLLKDDTSIRKKSFLRFQGLISAKRFFGM